MTCEPPTLLADAPELGAILAFLRDIGIGVSATTSLPPTVVPGMTVANGQLLYDETKPGWVGDLLHDAGHLAVADPAICDSLPEMSDIPHQARAGR